MAEYRYPLQSQKMALSNRVDDGKNHEMTNKWNTETGRVNKENGKHLQHKDNTGINRNIIQFYIHNQNSVSMMKPAQGRSQNLPKIESQTTKNSTNEDSHAHNSAVDTYNNAFGKMRVKHNLGMHSTQPLQRIQMIFSPYDRVQAGLEYITTEVHNQRSEISVLQKSVDKMKKIFSTMQGDIQNLVKSFDDFVNDI
jgi:hypothetical protein